MAGTLEGIGAAEGGRTAEAANGILVDRDRKCQGRSGRAHSALAL
jgi:hypothetical protein